MKIVKDRRTIQGKHVFTQDETKDNTEKLLSIMREKEQIEKEAKQVSAQYKNKIAGKDLELEALRTALENGHEYRPFECEAVKNFDSGYMEFIDELTGNLIAKEKLTANDYQTNMDDQLKTIAENNKRDDASDQLGLVIADKVEQAGAAPSIFDEAVAQEEEQIPFFDALEEEGIPMYDEHQVEPVTAEDDQQTTEDFREITGGQIPREETFSPPVVEPVKEKAKRASKAIKSNGDINVPVPPPDLDESAPGLEGDGDDDWWND